MTEPQSLQVGDFAKNIIHGYITMLYKNYDDILHMKSPWSGWDALIVETKEDWTNDFIKAGILRSELHTELEKISATLPLIKKVKEYLDRLNTASILDNLTYIEILHKLNEQEKALENKL
jgi:hypothetical protein